MPRKPGIRKSKRAQISPTLFCWAQKGRRYADWGEGGGGGEGGGLGERRDPVLNHINHSISKSNTPWCGRTAQLLSSEYTGRASEAGKQSTKHPAPKGASKYLTRRYVTRLLAIARKWKNSKHAGWILPKRSNEEEALVKSWAIRESESPPPLPMRSGCGQS